MCDYEIGKKMYQEAMAYIEQRYPQGWGGCAVLRTEDDQYLVSVGFDSFNMAANLCMETGAMCEAQKYNLKVTHSLCVSRNSAEEELKILTACGICQERFQYWGKAVKIAITNPENQIVFWTLEELTPNYWGDAFEER